MSTSSKSVFEDKVPEDAVVSPFPKLRPARPRKVEKDDALPTEAPRPPAAVRKPSAKEDDGKTPLKKDTLVTESPRPRKSFVGRAGESPLAEPKPVKIPSTPDAGRKGTPQTLASPTPQSRGAATPKGGPITPLGKPSPAPSPSAGKKGGPAPLKPMSGSGKFEGKTDAEKLMLNLPQDPTSPNSPLPPQRVLLQLRPEGDKDVLPPEVRRQMAREQMDVDTKASIPQLRSDREEVEVASPEERRKLAMSQERKLEYAQLALGNDNTEILSPEERRRLAREAREARERAAGDGMDEASDVTGVTRRSSRASQVPSRQTMSQPPQSAAVVSARTPLRSPMTPAGFPCPRCDALQQQVGDLESNATEMRHRIAHLEEENRRLSSQKPASPKGAAKRHREETAKKDRQIAALEKELLEMEKRALSAAIQKKPSHPSTPGTAGVAGEDREKQFAALQEMLEQKDAEIAELRTRLEAAEYDHSDYEASVSAMSAADDEVTMLNSQIWSLETAIEFKRKEIDRINTLLHEFVGKVEQLDHDLAQAMRRLMESGSSEARDEERAVLGKTVEEAVSEMKEKRDEHKQKRKRRPRKGKLAKENAELREELNDLSATVLEMRKAMAANNPTMFLSAYAAAAGKSPGGAMLPAAVPGMPTKPCCFQAAFVAAGQAEAQKEQLNAQLQDRQRRVDWLTETLNRARNAIVSSAGVGYENEIKLQQARKALQLILDYPEGMTSPRGTTAGGTAVTPHSTVRPAIASPAPLPSARSSAAAVPVPVLPIAMPSATAVTSPSQPIQPRNVSPSRKEDPQKAVMAWMTANPQHQPQELQMQMRLHNQAEAPNVGAQRLPYTARR